MSHSNRKLRDNFRIIKNGDFQGSIESKIVNWKGEGATRPIILKNDIYICSFVCMFKGLI